MLADSDLRYADIQACCSCLGFRENDVYKIDVDAEASIRTLLRYLRNENNECDVRRELGRLRIVSSDLIPLLRSCANNKLLTELVIRLLMNLTQPAIVCFRQEIPKDRDLYGAYVQVDELLKSYKKAYADEELFRTLGKLVGDMMDRKWEDRSEEDRLLVERVLILVRNVLHIAPDMTEEKRTDEDVSVHDQLLWAMHLSGWDELLLFLGNAEDEHMFVFHTLEIISLMLREQTPEILSTTGNGSSAGAVKMSDCSQRRWAMESEEKRRFLRDAHQRQNRFGGTYELCGTASLSHRPLIYHHDVTTLIQDSQSLGSRKSLNSSMEPESGVGIVNLDLGKKQARKPKNRKPLIERSMHRRSILAVQVYLQKFCWQFLQFCYNPIMRAAKASLTRKASQENDETYYLWSMRFFMAFSRLYKFRSALLSETLNTSTFHWIYDQVMNFRDLMLADKRGGGTNRRAVQASRRLELAISTYREFLACLSRMLRPTAADRIPEAEANETDEIVQERIRVQTGAADSIMANVLYVSEYHEVYPILIKDFNEAIQSREYLRNLVEGAYLYIGLLTDRVKEAGERLFIQQRRVVRQPRQSEKPRASQSRRDKHEANDEADDDDEDTPELRKMRLDYQWSHQLMEPLIGYLANPDSLPEVSEETEEDPEESRLFDATATGTESRQLRSGVRRVQATLYAGNAAEALRLARRLWRLWPEVAPITVDENDAVLADPRVGALIPGNVAVLAALRQIHATEFEDEEEEEGENVDAEDKVVSDAERDDLYNEEMGLVDPDGPMTVTKEVQMDATSFILRFAHPRVVHAFSLLLAECASNPRSTNSAVVHIIHRLVVRHKLAGSFFQLRLFHVFQQFLRNSALANAVEFRDLANLIKYILRKFFQAVEKNNAVLIELLFFKTVKEGFEAAEGYGTFDDGKKSIKWNEELDAELTRLFEAYRQDPVPRGSDLADVLTNHLSDVTKTRRQVVARLIHMDLVASLKQLKQMTIRSESERPKHRARAVNDADSLEWTEDEVTRLRALVEDHRGSKTLLSTIMTDLRMDNELALRRQAEQEEEETGENVESVVVPPLRSRLVIRAKLLELGFVNNPSELGRSGRRRTGGPIRDRCGALNVDLDRSGVSGGRPAKRRRKRRGGGKGGNSSSDDGELRFQSDDQDAGDEDDSDGDSSDEQLDVPADVSPGRQKSSSDSSDNERAPQNTNPPRPRLQQLTDSESDSESNEPRLRIVDHEVTEVEEESNPRGENQLETNNEAGLQDASHVLNRRRTAALESSSDEAMEEEKRQDNADIPPNDIDGSKLVRRTARIDSDSDD